MFIRFRETKTMDLDSVIYWLAAKDCQILEFVGLNKIATDLGCYPLFQSNLAAELNLYYWMGAITGFSIISVVLSLIGSIFKGVKQ